MKNDVKIIDTFFIKSKTNGGDLAKQYFKYCILESDNTQTAIIVNKFVLSKDIKLYRSYNVLRKFKDKYLFYTRFSLKPDTMKKVVDWLNSVENQV